MLSPEEHQERLNLYLQGLNDKEIGKRQNVSKQTVARWRKRLGLPPAGSKVASMAVLQISTVKNNKRHRENSNRQAEIDGCKERLRRWAGY